MNLCRTLKKGQRITLYEVGPGIENPQLEEIARFERDSEVPAWMPDYLRETLPRHKVDEEFQVPREDEYRALPIWRVEYGEQHIDFRTPAGTYRVQFHNIDLERLVTDQRFRLSRAARKRRFKRAGSRAALLGIATLLGVVTGGRYAKREWELARARTEIRALPTESSAARQALEEKYGVLISGSRADVENAPGRLDSIEQFLGDYARTSGTLAYIRVRPEKGRTSFDNRCEESASERLGGCALDYGFLINAKGDNGGFGKNLYHEGTHTLLRQLRLDDPDAAEEFWRRFLSCNSSVYAGGEWKNFSDYVARRLGFPSAYGMKNEHEDAAETSTMHASSNLVRIIPEIRCKRLALKEFGLLLPQAGYIEDFSTEN